MNKEFENTGAYTEALEYVEKDINEVFSNMYTRKDFELQLKKVINSGYSKAALGEFYIMFERYNIAHPRNKVKFRPDTSGKGSIWKSFLSVHEYENLIRDMDLCNDIDELEDRLLKVISEKYVKYPLPALRMHDLLERIKPDMPSELYKKYQAASDRLKILMLLCNAGGLSYTEKLKISVHTTNICTGEEKIEEKEKSQARYIVAGIIHIRKYVCKKLKKNENEYTDITDTDILFNICDDIFDVLKTANKDFVKPGGTGEILRMANDLANGTFNENTKRYLYLFAIAAGLRYRSKDDLDIEEQLFEKYYIDIPQETDPSKKITSPNGQHINYNNFEELVYLHFLQKPGYDRDSIKEKLRGSDLMIRRLIIRSEDQEYLTGSGRTIEIRNNAEKILKITDDRDFEDSLFCRYVCKKEKFINIGVHQNTAYDNYKKYREKLFKKWNIDENIKAEAFKFPDGTDAGLGFTKEKYEKYDEENKNFRQILEQADKMLGKNALFIKKSENMSRTALIAVYYYFYISETVPKCKGPETEDRMNFYQFFYDFVEGCSDKGFEGMSSVLQNSFYEDDFSLYNLFDMLVICSAYILYLHKIHDRENLKD